jgi:hypothetical protein
MTKLKHKPRQGQTFSMWGREHRILRVSPTGDKLVVAPTDGSGCRFCISLFHARRQAAKSPPPGAERPAYPAALPVDSSDPYWRLRFAFGSDRVEEAMGHLGDRATPETVRARLYGRTA